MVFTTRCNQHHIFIMVFEYISVQQIINRNITNIYKCLSFCTKYESCKSKLCIHLIDIFSKCTKYSYQKYVMLFQIDHETPCCLPCINLYTMLSNNFSNLYLFFLLVYNSSQEFSLSISLLSIFVSRRNIVIQKTKYIFIDGLHVKTLAHTIENSM